MIIMTVITVILHVSVPIHTPTGAVQSSKGQKQSSGANLICRPQAMMLTSHLGNGYEATARGTYFPQTGPSELQGQPPRASPRSGSLPCEARACLQ